jgi:hypothetical protein
VAHAVDAVAAEKLLLDALLQRMRFV